MKKKSRVEDIIKEDKERIRQISEWYEEESKDFIKKTRKIIKRGGLSKGKKYFLGGFIYNCDDIIFKYTLTKFILRYGEKYGGNVIFKNIFAKKGGILKIEFFKFGKKQIRYIDILTGRFVKFKS